MEAHVGLEVSARPSTAGVLAATLVLSALYGCSSGAAPRSSPARPDLAAAPASISPYETGTALAAAHNDHLVAGLANRAFAPEAYWRVLQAVLVASPDRFDVRPVAESIEGRPIRRIDFGHGEPRVLLWSQMHGNESTASRALVDIFAFLARNPDNPIVRSIEAGTRLTVIPVLNPDGAARFWRHNALGVDINRDARLLATPEARALKSVRDEINAEWGFNLHDQNVRTRLGRSNQDVQISLLAPPPGSRVTNPAMERAKKLATVVARAIEPVVGNAIGRYDEGFNPRAFGDLMTQWGTGTVLIESGGTLADPQKDRLRAANFVGILTALLAIADGSWEDADPGHYANLPLNGAQVYDLIVRGGQIVLPGRRPIRSDFAVNFLDTLQRNAGAIVEVGDLADARALEVIDAAGLFFLPDSATLSQQEGRHLRLGDPANGVLARDPDGANIAWYLQDGRARTSEIQRRP